ncbi:MAG: hypothetical protein AB1445_14005 [Bacillota bacterium]
MSGRKAAIAVCILVSLVALSSTGWTLARWLASYRTIRRLDIGLREVQRLPDEEATFVAHIIFVNAGPVDVCVEGLFATLRWHQKLVAFSVVHPKDLYVPAQQTVPFSLTYRSNLTPDSLPPGESSPQDQAWSIKAHVVVRPTTRQGVFRLNLERRPDQ